MPHIIVQLTVVLCLAVTCDDSCIVHPPTHPVMFFLPNCAYHMDYHWDCHLLPCHHPLYAQTLLIFAYLPNSVHDSYYY
jgi:hypothetical protein